MNTDLILTWLWPATLASLLIFTIGLALVSLLRRSSAAVRHFIFTTAFIATAAYSAALLLPKWQMAVLASSPGSFGRQTVSHSAQTETAPTITVISSDETFSIPAPPFVLGRRGLLSLIWLAGTVFFLGRLAAGLVALTRITRTSSDSKIALPCATTARLRLSSKIDVPLSWGWLRPQILLPSSFPEWSTDQQRLALLHEIAHVRRRDWAVLMLAQLVRSIFWINPLAWIALRQLQAEQEKAADDLVLADSSANSYATALLDFARRLHSTSSLPAVPILRKSGSLEDRVRSLLNERISRRRPGAVHLVVTAGIVLAITLSAIVQLTARETNVSNHRELSEEEKRFIGQWRGGGMFPSTFTFKPDGTYEVRTVLDENGDQRTSFDRNRVEGTWSIDRDLLTYKMTSPTNAPAKTRRILQVSSNFFQWQFVGEETKNIFGYHRLDNIQLGTIAGTVLRQGKPLTETAVLLEPFTPDGKALPNTARTETKTDNEGRFAFHGLAPGLYKVSRSIQWDAITDQASSTTATWTHAQIIQLEKDKTAEITLGQGRTIRGELLPPPGMTKDQIAFTAGDFRFITPAQSRPDGIPIVYVIEINRDGAFLIPGLPPGQYSLYATVRKMNAALDADHIASASTQFTIPNAPGDHDLGKIQLTAPRL